MTKGALIFAYNNDAVDYVRLARWTAANVKRHLGIPVALVTDATIEDEIFDHVVRAEKQEGNGKYFADYQESKPWYNLNRSDAYDLSPWDETLVLDADYIVGSPQLKNVFDIDQDFLAHRWAHEITGEEFASANHFGDYNMPMWWATVMYFRRSDASKMIFDTMKMIRHNWKHYCNLYQCRRTSFRNDYALSIALNLVNGHVQPVGIPWSMPTLIASHKIRQISQDAYKIDWIDSENRARWIEIRGQDLHAMGKKDLGEIIADPS